VLFHHWPVSDGSVETELGLFEAGLGLKLAEVGLLRGNIQFLSAAKICLETKPTAPSTLALSLAFRTRVGTMTV